jgi:hypothetical protein
MELECDGVINFFLFIVLLLGVIETLIHSKVVWNVSTTKFNHFGIVMDG